MTGEATDIKYSRGKIVWLLLLSICCFMVALLCFYFAAWFGVERVLLAQLAGAVGMFLFGATFCVAVYKFHIKKPAVILYGDGFVYNRGNYKTHYVYWSQVQNISPMPFYGTLHITLFPQQENLDNTKQAERIVVPANLLMVNLQGLYIMFVQQWVACKKEITDAAARLALAPILKIKAAEELITADESEVLCNISVEEVIGKCVIDILVKRDYNEEYGLDIIECFLFLECDIAIGIPHNRSKHALSTTIARQAESIFFSSWGNASHPLRNKKLIDVIFYKEKIDDKALLELDNGYFITEKNIAPREMGIAGLWVYNSIGEMEKRHGKDYTRWSKEGNG